MVPNQFWEKNTNMGDWGLLLNIKIELFQLQAYAKVRNRSLKQKGNYYTFL